MTKRGVIAYTHLSRSQTQREPASGKPHKGWRGQRRRFVCCLQVGVPTIAVARGMLPCLRFSPRDSKVPSAA